MARPTRGPFTHLKTVRLTDEQNELIEEEVKERGLSIEAAIRWSLEQTFFEKRRTAVGR